MPLADMSSLINPATIGLFFFLGDFRDNAGWMTRAQWLPPFHAGLIRLHVRPANLKIMQLHLAGCEGLEIKLSILLFK